MKYEGGREESQGKLLKRKRIKGMTRREEGKKEKKRKKEREREGMKSGRRKICRSERTR